MEKRNRLSVGDAADEIAACNRLIEAGVNSGDQELIQVAIERWSRVWPEEVVEQHVEMNIKDLEERLQIK